MGEGGAPLPLDGLEVLLLRRGESRRGPGAGGGAEVLVEGIAEALVELRDGGVEELVLCFGGELDIGVAEAPSVVEAVAKTGGDGVAAVTEGLFGGALVDEEDACNLPFAICRLPFAICRLPSLNPRESSYLS